MQRSRSQKPELAAVRKRDRTKRKPPARTSGLRLRMSAMIPRIASKTPLRMMGMLSRNPIWK
jgi:hypothetical protein